MHSLSKRSPCQILLRFFPVVRAPDSSPSLLLSRPRVLPAAQPLAAVLNPPPYETVLTRSFGTDTAGTARVFYRRQQNAPTLPRGPFGFRRAVTEHAMLRTQQRVCQQPREANVGSSIYRVERWSFAGIGTSSGSLLRLFDFFSGAENVVPTASGSLHSSSRFLHLSFRAVCG